MKYRMLGQSGIKVSEICLGTMMFGGPTHNDEANRIVADAAENGINFIDTANNYQQGKSESIVGRAIANRRGDWVLATKVGMKPPDSSDIGGLSRAQIRQAVDDSLKRLRTDYIDIYYTHRTDNDIPWGQTIAAMGELIVEGKIRSFGISNIPAWQISLVVMLCEKLGVLPPAACQPYYNLVNRQPEVEVFPACKSFGLGVVPYSPVARGVLTGKYSDGQTPDNSRAGRRDGRLLGAEWRKESFEIAQRIKTYTFKRNALPSHFAFAWVLNNSTVSSVLAGPRTFEQWQDYIAALRYRWSEQDEQFADHLVAPGHSSTHGFTDPKFPVEGRYPTVGRTIFAGK